MRRGFGNNGDYAFIMILIVIMKTRHGPGEFARQVSSSVHVSNGDTLAVASNRVGYCLDLVLGGPQSSNYPD